jgi:hypothetical protein
VHVRERERERERLINDNFALMKEACKRRREAEIWRTYSCSYSDMHSVVDELAVEPSDLQS